MTISAVPSSGSAPIAPPPTSPTLTAPPSLGDSPDASAAAQAPANATPSLSEALNQADSAALDALSSYTQAAPGALLDYSS